MGRKALLLEAKSAKHLAAHTPHNPLCEFCVRAHMRQRQYAKKREPEDTQLENVTEPLKQLGTDTMILAKSSTHDSRTSDSQNSCAHTIRDEWSGMALAIPQQSRNADANYNNF